MKKKSILLAAIVLLLLAPISGREVPALRGPVNDLAGLLSPDQHRQLSDYLTTVDRQTGVQIAVLTIPSLGGRSLEAYSMQVVEAWQLGQVSEDNGVLLLVALEDRAIRIEVGYGLEGSLTDATSGLIIRNVISPQFQRGNFAAGISEGVRNIVGVATGDTEIVAEAVRNPPRENNYSSGWGGLLFMIIFGLIISGRGRRRGGIWGWLLLGSLMSGSRRSSFGGSSLGSRGSFGGRSSFGGFSGGGGSFGGGGASGRW